MNELMIIAASAALTFFSLLIATVLLFKDDLKNIMSYRKIRTIPFSCRRCAGCCSKTVVLNSSDKARLREHNIDLEQATQKVFGAIRVMRRNKRNECVYCSSEPTTPAGEKKSLCTIYEARPAACRNFPFINYRFAKGADCRCTFVKQSLKDCSKKSII